VSADPSGALGTAVTARARFGDLAEQVALVEGLGYTSVWLPEISGRDALVTLGALAGRTERIRLATGLVPLPSRPLAALTMAAAAVAELAPGRFTLGLGAGHRETAAHYGWARPARVTELEQAVVAIRRALRDGHLSGAGPAGPVDLALQGVHVEVLPEFVVGALRPRMAGMAGRVADGILLNWVTVERARTVVSAARAAEAQAEAGHRALRVSCYVPVCVTEDPAEQEEARAVVAHQLGSYTRLRAYGDLLVEDGYADEVAAVRAASAEQRGTAVSRRLIDAVALIGDTTTVREGLDAYRQVGVDEPVLAPLAVGADPGASLTATWAALAD
jgi:alkanesulfonate monooxygenase SsuD/methylene tetrahydromethanopterin reductase-like flavin-dependent oxidoreductase (luciferase family)